MCFRVMFMSLSSVHDALGVVSSLNSLKFIELRIPYGFEQKGTVPIPSNNSCTYLLLNVILLTVIIFPFDWIVVSLKSCLSCCNCGRIIRVLIINLKLHRHFLRLIVWPIDHACNVCVLIMNNKLLMILCIAMLNSFQVFAMWNTVTKSRI